MMNFLSNGFGVVFGVESAFSFSEKLGFKGGFSKLPIGKG